MIRLSLTSDTDLVGSLGVSVFHSGIESSCQPNGEHCVLLDNSILYNSNPSYDYIQIEAQDKFTTSVLFHRDR